MEFHEVKSLRERRFGLTPKTAIRDASGAREFIHRVGFCFTGKASGLLLPSFLGAVVLSPEPVAKVAARPGSKAAKRPPAPRTGEDIILPLLREKSVFEGRLLRDRNTLVSSPFLPYFYALVGEAGGTEAGAPGDPPPDEETEDDGAPVGDEGVDLAEGEADAEGDGDEATAPKAAPAAKKKAAAKKKPSAKKPKAKKKTEAPATGASDSPEATLHALLAAEGPTGARTLAVKFSKATGLDDGAMNDAVRRLESRLRVATIDHSDSDGPVYDTFERFRPDAVREGRKLPRLEAAMRVLGRYFETVVAAEASHVADVFGGVFSSEEIPELLKALEERKEVDPDTQIVPGKTYWVCREAAWGDL
jgi:hypothetical protein